MAIANYAWIAYFSRNERDYMTFRNFVLSGDEVISPLAKEAPFRCDRLMCALEAFVVEGAALGTLVVGRPEGAAVYLVPSRDMLRAVPDAAALVVVDVGTRTLELINVLDEYGANDAAEWPKLVASAQSVLG